jgi:tocopherol cyclase
MAGKLYRIFHPEIFQGGRQKNNYFEGWYFKNVSAGNRHAIAFIPGISLSDDSHSFVQFIDGVNMRSTIFRYQKEEFIPDKSSFKVKTGASFFSRDRIELNLVNDEYKIKGELNYNKHLLLPKSILSPGIMGWYSYAPGMECNHGVVSADNSITGALDINGVKYDFDGGKGYIEKDWGISFPESWIWLQCNSFDKPDISLMVSIARVPWKGSYFIGLIAFLAIEGKIRIFATWNGGKVNSLSRIDDKFTEIVLAKGRESLEIKVRKRGSGALAAPVMGSMTKTIKESIDSEVELNYSKSGKNILTTKGVRAGYEEMEKIFSYFGTR